MQRVSQTADTLFALLDAVPISDLPATTRSKLRRLKQRLTLMLD
jgi:hypothetical protein